MVDLLTGTVMPYAWGSRTAIATLQGRRTPSSRPEAELWMGAHPLAPSLVRRDGTLTPLDAVIAEDANRELGATTARRFGARLPFLLKVLAADQPLSLQAHPTAAQAAAGFADEERRGVARDAPHRNYKDPFHKPELICALTPFDAICGFRRIADTLALADELRVPDFAVLLAPLRAQPNAAGLEATLRAVMTIDPAIRVRTVASVVEACRRYHGRFQHECGWSVRLNAQYSGDAGVISALLLNFIRLEPGQAIYLGAGHLHAYLQGVGIELMSASDNVLRGGLTPKHVDVPELLNVLQFSDGPIPVVRSHRIDDDETAWDTPAEEFRLTRIQVAGRPVTRTVDGPEILLCIEGAVQIEGAAREASPQDAAPVRLERGQSVFVPGTTGHYSITGAGSLFRATVGVERSS